MSTAERLAAVRLLLAIYHAASADVDHERFGAVLGFIAASSHLGAEDLRMQTGADRLHEHAARLADHVAELERR